MLYELLCTLRRRVSLESLKFTNLAWPSAKALMQLPSAKRERLMWAPSCSLFPLFWGGKVSNKRRLIDQILVWTYLQTTNHNTENHFVSEISIFSFIYSTRRSHVSWGEFYQKDAVRIPLLTWVCLALSDPARSIINKRPSFTSSPVPLMADFRTLTCQGNTALQHQLKKITR